jgi:hypothetical protein
MKDRAFAPIGAVVRAAAAFTALTALLLAAALAALALGAAAALGAQPLGAAVTTATAQPLAHASRILNVRAEGRLRFVRASGSTLLDEGRVSGSFPGTVKVRFLYNGAPTVSAQFTISGAGGSISARASGRLSSPVSVTPSFSGHMQITGGSGRYAHVRGSGQLFGVFNRRTYALSVQAIGKLPY